MTEGTESLVHSLISREDTAYFGADQPEQIRWIGKPWRRVELLTQRVFYRGEEIDRTRTLSIHFGLRRLGFGITISLVKASVLDYSEERQ